MICITETWLNPTFPDSLIINGSNYSIYRCDCVQQRGGGCAILIHNSLKSIKLNLPDTIKLGEVESISVKVYCGNRNVVINCSYNPPGYCADGLNAISDIYCFLCDRYIYTLMLGDFNVPNLYNVMW